MTRRALAATVAALSGLAAASLHAEGNPYRLGVSQTVTHESNLLRLGDTQVLQPGFSRSDTVWSTSLLAGLDQSISRQRVFGDAMLRSTRLSHNEVFDHEAYALRVGLDWATIGRISGSINAGRARHLASFSNANGGATTERTLETTERASVTVRYGLVERLSAEVTIDHQSVDYSSVLYARRELTQSGHSVGVRFRASPALGAAVAWREVRGRYPHSFAPTDGGGEADEFHRRGLDLSVDWVPTGASRFDARLSQSSIHYERASQRNFSGLTGVVGWSWRPRDKLSLNTKLQRRPGQATYLLGSDAEPSTLEFSRMTTSLATQARYQHSAKVTLRAGLSYARRRLESTLLVGELDAVSSADSDHETVATLGAAWQPRRSISLGCDFRHERRTGSSLSLATRARALACHGQLTLN